MGVLFPVILSRADLIRAEAKTCADRSRRDLTPVASGDEILSFGFAQDRRFAPGRSYSPGNDNCRHPRPATNVLATNVFRRPKWPALTALMRNCGHVPPCDATTRRCLTETWSAPQK